MDYVYLLVNPRACFCLLVVQHSIPSPAFRRPLRCRSFSLALHRARSDDVPTHSFPTLASTVSTA